jgi:hypothetical protein
MRARAVCLMLVSIVACEGSPGAPDAVEVNPTGNVHLTVTQDGAPKSGVMAYFLEADNTLVASAPTDATGQAAANLQPGGSVTIVHEGVLSSADRYELESWVDVQPGDQLAVDLPHPLTTIQQQATTSASSIADAMAYRVIAPCGGATMTLGSAFDLQLLCAVDAPATIDLTAIAIGTTGHAIAAIYDPGVAVGSAAPVAIDGAWVSTQNVPITYENADDVGTLYATVTSANRLGRIDYDDIALSATTGTFAWPAQISSGTRVVSTSIEEQSIVSWAPVAESVDIDFAGHVGQLIQPYPVLDKTAGTLSWTVSASGVPANLNVATISAGSSTWTLVSPGSTTQIALPRVPVSSVASSELSSGFVTGLVVPAGVTYANVLGSAGYFSNFAGLIAASPSGAVTMMTTPSSPL